jgi:hypothetical protein
MRWLNFSLLLLSIVLLFLLHKGCDTQNKYKDLSVKYEDAVRVKDSLGRTIYIKDVKIVENQQSIKDLRAKLFETSDKYNKKVLEVKALVASKTKVKTDTIDVPYEDTVKLKKWKDSVYKNCNNVIQFYEDSAVLVGTTAKDSTQHYKIDATVKKSGIRVNEIQFIDSQYLSITEYRGGFLMRDDYGKLNLYLPRKTKVEIKHTNPYFKNNGTSAFYQKKKSNCFGGGVVFGTVIALLLMSIF